MIKNVLIVEDNRASHVLMREAFAAASFNAHLTIVDNGDEAMQFLKRKGDFSGAQRPDLILLDLNLPGKSGVELMAEIKDDTESQSVPLIVLTGSNAEADIQACARFHCKYLLKPSRFHELVQLVKSLPDLI